MAEEPKLQTKMSLFIILLVALFVLVYAFAGNHLHMGVSGSFTYLIYIFLGLISSVVCYGLLSSMGEIKGHKYETRIKLGGAIVGLVVVGGGGMIYEKYVQKAATIDVRLVFYTKSLSQIQKINGEAIFWDGNKEIPLTLKNQSSALIQGLSSKAEGTPMRFSLDCPDFEIDSANYASLKIDPNNPIYVKLNPRKLYADPKEAKLSVTFNNGYSSNYIRRPEDKNIVIQVDVISESELIIPIAKEAELEIITNSGTPLVKTTLKSGDLTFLTNKNLKKIYYDGFVPNDKFEMAKGKTAFLTINYYDMTGAHRQQTWQTNFNFDLEE